MPIQTVEILELGEITVSKNRVLIMNVPNIGTSLVVVVYDHENKIGGLAHVVLPDSSIAGGMVDHMPGKYADLAIPHLMEEYMALGGQKRSSTVRIVGGAQLFNFGGGGGNILNIGARNATAILATMSKQGLAVEKADTGGNKSRSVRFILATGQLFVTQIGGEEYLL